jgi:hypothetical protein
MVLWKGRGLKITGKPSHRSKVRPGEQEPQRQGTKGRKDNSSFSQKAVEAQPEGLERHEEKRL